MSKNLTFLLLFFIGCSTTPKTHIVKKDSKELKLCFIGDTGSNDKNQKEVALKLKDENCDSVHFVGDIIYPHGIRNENDPQFKEKFFDYYKPVTETGKKPQLFMTMGNHDHRGSIRAWESLSKLHPVIFFPSPWYLVKMNDTCLTHIDTDYYRFFSNYFKRRDQINWLNNLDEELKDCKLKIALGHHPYNSSGKDHGDSNGDMRKILADTIIGKYDYYIAGHDHLLSDEGVVDGTRLLVSGAGGQRDYKVGGYLVIEVKEKDSSYFFRKLPE